MGIGQSGLKVEEMHHGWRGADRIEIGSTSRLRSMQSHSRKLGVSSLPNLRNNPEPSMLSAVARR
jgi:hypothetical protein